MGRGPDIKVVLYAGLSHARMPVPACGLKVVDVPVLADTPDLLPPSTRLPSIEAMPSVHESIVSSLPPCRLV
ncbi:MAG: hypothetical protein V8Q84_11630 [Bilophila sp.]